MTVQSQAPSPAVMAGMRRPAQTEDALPQGEMATQGEIDEVNVELDACVALLKSIDGGRFYWFLRRHLDKERLAWLKRRFRGPARRIQLSNAILAAEQFRKLAAWPELVRAAIAAAGDPVALAELESRRIEALSVYKAMPASLRQIGEAQAGVVGQPLRPNHKWPLLLMSLVAIEEVTSLTAGVA